MRRFLAATAIAVSALAIVVGVAAATPNGSDTLVTVSSPPSPFAQNKQNEGVRTSAGSEYPLRRLPDVARST